MKEAHINGKSKKGRSTRCTFTERAREETVDCICIVLIVNLTVLIVCTISVCVRVCISFLLFVVYYLHLYTHHLLWIDYLKKKTFDIYTSSSAYFTRC